MQFYWLQSNPVNYLVRGVKAVTDRYICRSSHGFADTDMSTMIKQLRREEEDLCGYRGLLPGTYQQTFSVRVPPKLRIYYNRLMTMSVSVSAGGCSGDGSARPSSPGDFKMNSVDRMVKTYHNINKFFCAFLEHVSIVYSKVVW